VLDKVEKAVRDMNPWLRAEETIEDIDTAMEELTKRRAELEKEAAGKGSS